MSNEHKFKIGDRVLHCNGQEPWEVLAIHPAALGAGRYEQIVIRKLSTGQIHVTSETFLSLAPSCERTPIKQSLKIEMFKGAKVTDRGKPVSYQVYPEILQQQLAPLEVAIAAIRSKLDLWEKCGGPPRLPIEFTVEEFNRYFVDYGDISMKIIGPNFPWSPPGDLAHS